MNMAELTIAEQIYVISKCSDRQWSEMLYGKRLLNGISPDFFIKHLNARKKILGPSLTKDGTIVGDMFNMETMIFNFVAGDVPCQIELFNYLLNNSNYVRMREYVLVITGGIEIWKKDINMLSYISKELKREEISLENEVSHLIKSVHNENHSVLTEVVKKFLPDIYSILRSEHKVKGEVLRSIEKAVSEIGKIEEQIKKEMIFLHRDFPFLFTN